MISGYNAWSVVAFEVPTTAKWNYLGTNDAAFYSSVVALEAGWVPASVTWTYASATTHSNTNTAYSGTFTISGDVTAIYKAGTRLKWVQGGTTRYAIVMSSAYSAPNTTVKVFLGTDYQLAATAITVPYISYAKAPPGFPTNPDKWMVYFKNVTNTTQATPSANTWYNVGTSNLVIPIGTFDVEYFLGMGQQKNSTTVITISSTLSTANNSESDVDFTCYADCVVATGNITLSPYFYRRKTLTLTTAANYYLNGKTGESSAGTMKFRGGATPTIIRATCALL